MSWGNGGLPPVEDRNPVVACLVVLLVLGCLIVVVGLFALVLLWLIG